MTQHDDKDNEVVIVELPRWKIKLIEKIAEERQAYDVLTSKAKNFWIWVVAGGFLAVYSLWDTIKIKVGF